jgi:hypothetical protein
MWPCPKASNAMTYRNAKPDKNAAIAGTGDRFASAGLGSAGIFGERVPGALSVIEHLGYVQIDTISVVERAHHHILWSRSLTIHPSGLPVARRTTRF